MLISEAWLREWVDPAISTEELVRILTMAGLEVDGTEAAAGSFTGVVVAEVRSVEKHPDADKLNVCAVYDGTETFQVVCGAPNVRAGMRAPFARVGAVLGADFKIRKAKLRGVESQGMLCSAEELGMAESSEGLLELPVDAPVGQDVREYLKLDDTLIEVDLTPNRGDCLSLCGLARELGVLTRSEVQAPAVQSVAASIEDSFPVSIAAASACPRYLGRVIRDINPAAETPLWMQEKLRRCGLRSIDPVVDVTNYVLLEFGQPMHAFDLDALQGGIKVRLAEAGEKLRLLDDKEVELQAETLLITDQQGPVAMAGVMGGKHSAVTPETRNIFLECAYFAPLAIAGRARAYGMHTDASHRYERGVDPQLQPLAMERATALLLEIVGGAAGPVVESQGELPESPTVRLRKERIESLLGMALPDEEVLDILQRLGITCTGDDAFGWTFAVPSWRFDISIEEDLIEELARVHGYDNLPVTAPQMQAQLRPTRETRLSLRRLRHALADLGYQEVVTYSFVDRKLDQQLAELARPEDYQPVSLANPISQDMAVMRSSLWAGLLKTLQHNRNRQQSRARLFETGLVFNIKNNEIKQEVKVGCLLWGEALPEQWGTASRAADFFDLKGDLEVLLGMALKPGELQCQPELHPALQPGQSARLYRQGRALGWLGALHPALTQALDIPGKVFVAELDYELASATEVTVLQEISRFPAVRRDLALLVREQVQAADILALLQEVAGEALQDISVFDLYHGQNIEKGKKSLALGLTFQHPSRTLEDSEINPIIDSCINELQAKFNAELR